MISETIQKAINDQINAELYSSYLYLSMSAYFEGKNLKGFAKWMRTRPARNANTPKSFSIICGPRRPVTLKAITAPPVRFQEHPGHFRTDFCPRTACYLAH